MSSTDGSTEDVGGFEEFVPAPLMPVWIRLQTVQEFRETHGDSYTKVLEGIVAAILTGGYLFWLFLYFTA
ncbi:hypothetical protein SAMN04487948_12615 [Halogranum amylolyticum]|uniref:Yip1 domain-containing protein n=1 Tax=Halogranum amylolyticum TaxID=660520 RepID=A0A1H8WAQ6_9EURY|nr:hypothetical protein [Halogranum amylolyticum]SEP24613.1 hypothetical protein SAMN04487948_12615 [Halogranum amylolyticum]